MKKFIEGAYINEAGVRNYKLHVAAFHGGEAQPLFVMLRGCDQDATGFAIGTRMNELAEECRGVVLYPEQFRLVNPLAASDFLTVEVWTGRGLVTHYLLFVLSLADRVVTIVGITTRPDESWMLQIARNMTDLSQELCAPSATSSSIETRDTRGNFGGWFSTVDQGDSAAASVTEPECLR